MSQADILKILGKGKGLSELELSKILNITNKSVNTNLKKLLKQNEVDFDIIYKKIRRQKNGRGGQVRIWHLK